jgi:hypothetical protein
MKNLVSYNLFEMAKIDVDYQKEILRNFLHEFRKNLIETTHLYDLLENKMKEIGYEPNIIEYNLFERPQYVREILFFEHRRIRNRDFTIKYSFYFDEYYSHYILRKNLSFPNANAVYDIKKYRINQIDFSNYDKLSDELVSLIEEDLSKLNKENIYKY